MKREIEACAKEEETLFPAVTIVEAGCGSPSIPFDGVNHLNDGSSIQ